MRTTKRISVIGLIAVMVMLYCCPVFAAEEEWTRVDDLKIDEKTVYTYEELLAFDINGNDIIDGLTWNGDACVLTMNGAKIKSIEYKTEDKGESTKADNEGLTVNNYSSITAGSNEDDVLTLNLVGEENIVASDIEPKPNPLVPGFETKKPAVYVHNMKLIGSGTLEVTMLVDSDVPKHYAMDCEYLELSSEFYGKLIVNHTHAGGPSIHSREFEINGGELQTNAEIDTVDMLINDGSVNINVENYASAAICTSDLNPKMVSGQFIMNGGNLNIVNHQTLYDVGGLARGIWSGQDIQLNDGIININCDEEAICCENHNATSKLILNGAHLTAVSYNTAAVWTDELEVKAGNANLTGKRINIFINHKESNPVIGEQMKIIEPENGYFKTTEDIGGTCKTLLDKDGQITPRAVFAPKDYCVTFHGNGATWDSNPTRIQQATLLDDGNYYIKSDDFINPVKTGYHSEGWTYNGDKTFAFSTDIDPVGTVIPKEGLDVYQNLEPNEYYVIFDANGGLGEMDIQDFIYDEEQALEKNTFTRKGFEFVGWKNTETGETYSDEECVKNLTDELEVKITLQAQWKPVTSPINTGDNNPLYLYIALGGASALAIYMIIRKKACKQ